MLVFGLAIVVYSSATTSDASATAAACCCCHGDSCPMKVKDASGKEVAATHEGCECCNGDAASCPMMKKDADGKPVKAGEAAAISGTHIKHEMKADGSGCCCSCCHQTHDKEKTAAPAL